ncbi:MAG: hypothetical protein GY907_08745 [Bacteroidetes bacterium]|nr:hypothetical protein [Bacteroidota bacterium]
MNNLTKKYSVVFLILAVAFILVNLIGTKYDREVFIDGDGSGHYAYLTSIFIYGNVDFTEVFEFEKKQRPADYMGHYFHELNGIYINKYTVGTALLQLPFFLIGYLLSFLFGYPLDGYNIIFQYCVALSTIFWVSLGLVYLIKLMTNWGVHNLYSWIFSSFLLLGTNLFFYTFIEPSFSHAYSFTVITVFLYFSHKIFTAYNRYYFVMASFLLGIIILLRPANIIIIASLPFIAGGWVNLKNFFKNQIKNKDFRYGIAAFIIAISPQLIINYLQTGGILIYGYKNEGFYFTNPEVINFLISYKKGWLIYTPAFILLIPAIIYLFVKSTKFAAISFVLFLFFQIYIFSSWWNWFYGDSFGMRPMVDYYGLYMLVIGIFLYGTCHNWIKITGISFLVLCIILNLVQSFQYATGIIHPDSMNRAAYWYVFMDMDKSKSKIIASGDETFYGHLKDEAFFSSFNDLEHDYLDWNNGDNINHTVVFSGTNSVEQSSKAIYSPSLQYLIPDSLIGYNNIYVKFKTKYSESRENTAIKTVFVVDISDTIPKNIFYKTFRIKAIPDNVTNGWKNASIGFKLPLITNDMHQIKFYIWNVGNQAYYLDDLSIEFFTYEQP